MVCRRWFGATISQPRNKPTAPHDFVHVSDLAGLADGIEKLPASETRGGSICDVLENGKRLQAIRAGGVAVR